MLYFLGFALYFLGFGAEAHIYTTSRCRTLVTYSKGIFDYHALEYFDKKTSQKYFLEFKKKIMRKSTISQ
jgi:hypothetical protein